MSDAREQLAINGGTPAKQRPDPPMYPGGMAIDAEEEAAVLEVLRNKRLFRYYGPGDTPSKVAELEEKFAAVKGKRFALGVTSGTSALICGLRALGIGPGDEVIVPAYTWIASAAAILSCGAVPVIAEVDDSLLLDPVDLEAKITPYTRAVMPVHMRGAPCDMDAIMAVARRHNLPVIEDTAQANGASYHGTPLGAIGDVGCYSLQFNKIITSGEGGMVVTDDEELWKRAVMYHDVIGAQMRGFPREELLCGVNYRMPEMSAAVSLVQLRKLPGLIDGMRARKRMMMAGMADIAQQRGVQFQRSHDPDGDGSVALIFFMETPELAEKTAAALHAENIGASMLYTPDDMDYHVYAHWVPIMEQRLWSQAENPYAGAQREIHYDHHMCPRSLDWLGRAVHLNVNPLFTNEDIEETVEGINKVLAAVA